MCFIKSQGRATFTLERIVKIVKQHIGRWQAGDISGLSSDYLASVGVPHLRRKGHKNNSSPDNRIMRSLFRV